MSDSSSARRLIPIWMWFACWVAALPTLLRSDVPIYGRVIAFAVIEALMVGLFNRRTS